MKTSFSSAKPSSALRWEKYIWDMHRALCVSVSEGITSPAVPACIEHWPVHSFKPPPDKCLHMFHLFVLSCMLCSAIKQDVKWHFLKKWETALFPRGGACAQVENTGEARYQPSEAVARVLIRSRRHRAAFEATQEVSESAEWSVNAKISKMHRKIFIRHYYC